MSSLSGKLTLAVGQSGPPAVGQIRELQHAFSLDDQEIIGCPSWDVGSPNSTQGASRVSREVHTSHQENTMTKLLRATALMVGVGLMASPAFAGEITGPPPTGNVPSPPGTSISNGNSQLFVFGAERYASWTSRN